MFRKILAANDGSPGAFAALAAALDIAAKCGAELHMICVEEIPYFPATIDEVDEEREAAAHRFASVSERSTQLAAAKSVSLETHVIPGHPVPAIVDFVRSKALSTCERPAERRRATRRYSAVGGLYLSGRLTAKPLPGPHAAIARCAGIARPRSVNTLRDGSAALFAELTHALEPDC